MNDQKNSTDTRQENETAPKATVGKSDEAEQTKKQAGSQAN